MDYQWSPTSTMSVTTELPALHIGLKEDNSDHCDVTVARYKTKWQGQSASTVHEDPFCQSIEMY